MIQDLQTLDDLGIKFGTDKSSLHHDYLAYYERFFEKIRKYPIKLLEIGIYRGASLKVWHEYFVEGLIIGVDIDPSAVQFARARIRIEIIDQSNVEQLVQVGIKYGPFDIIIEDGSHMWEHQTTTFKTLFPFVRSGGIYVIEDLQTNYGSMEKYYRGNASISCMEYIKKIVDLRVADDQIDITKVEDAFARTYARCMNFVSFYRRACLIEKSRPKQNKHQQIANSLNGDGLENTVIPLYLLAHVGSVGDIGGESGKVRCVGDNQNIQGFLLAYSDDTVGEIWSRARLASGTWTEWVGLGEFSGTRGESKDLTGFSVRLGKGWPSGSKVEVVGAFRGEPKDVVVHGGEDCVPKSPLSKLFGIQLALHKGT